ncbi:putative signal transducing protein [Deferrisoma sp.]
MSWAEVYVALDAVEASAVTGLLASAGLEVRVRDMGVTPYPVSIGPLGEKRIEVPADRAEEARRVLRQAARDGYLRPGALVQEEDEA